VLFALALFVIQLNYKVDIMLMHRLTTVSEIGVYTIGVGIAQLTWALPQGITTALFSHSANAKDEQVFSRKVARLFRITVLIALMLIAGLYIMTPYVIPILYGEEFRRSVRVLQLLLPGVFCLLSLKILNMDLAGRGRPGISLCIMLPALLINIFLNILLLPRYGAYGAAIATSASYSVGGIGMMMLYCRVSGLTLRELWRYGKSDFDFVKQLQGAWERKKVCQSA
jgi:O-antigen/teichoic acid export membrane protein